MTQIDSATWRYPWPAPTSLTTPPAHEPPPAVDRCMLFIQYQTKVTGLTQPQNKAMFLACLRLTDRTTSSCATSCSHTYDTSEWCNGQSGLLRPHPWLRQLLQGIAIARMQSCGCIKLCRAGLTSACLCCPDLKSGVGGLVPTQHNMPGCTANKHCAASADAAC